MMRLPGSAMKPTTADAVGSGPMVLTLGSDFTKVGAPLTAQDKTPADIQQVQADKAVCVQ